MKAFADRLPGLFPALLLAPVLIAGCSDNTGQYGIDPTPYTQETAGIDPALQPPPTPSEPAATAEPDMPNPDTPRAADNQDNRDNRADRDPAAPLALQTAGKVELSDEQWRAILSTNEYYVLRKSGTEYAFTGRYLNNKDKGAYHCVGCGNKLYDAQHKFHSGCGWPSFFQEIETGSITTHEDRSLYPPRIEMRCARCDGHLGHVFADAPDQPTGLRHCVNGTALIFVPADADIKQVFRDHRAKFADQ